MNIDNVNGILLEDNWACRKLIMFSTLKVISMRMLSMHELLNRKLPIEVFEFGSFESGCILNGY